MRSFYPPVRAVLAALLVTTVLATACGASASLDDASNPIAASPADTDTPADSEAAAEPEPEPNPTEVPEAAAEPEPEPEPDPTEVPEAPADAVTFWSDVLVVGDCFDRSTLTGEFGEVPDSLPCDGLHEEEIYAVGRLDDGPDAPYQGSDAIADRVWNELCDGATIEFAGRPWDEVPFTTAALFPTEREWAAGDRGIMCSAASDVEGRLKIGTAGAGAREIDAQLVARSALSTPDVGEFEDWIVFNRRTLQDDALSLTDGSFDLQLRRPSATLEGLIFDATRVGEDGFATSITTIDFATGDIGEISVPVEGFEYSGTVGYGGSLVFAAREDADADWNLFSIFGDGNAVAIGDTDADEHYPSLSLNGEIVVFHRDGDLWRSNVDGTDQVQLTDTDANEWESEISPDGRWIVFVSDRGGSDDLWLMTIDGEEVTQLTDHPADEIWPTWTSDSSAIFFASDRFSPEGNHSMIMVMEPGDAQPSYYSRFTNVSHPLVLDPAGASIDSSTFPTLEERYFGTDDTGAASGTDVLAGDPGTLTPWEHSSGLLAADLPAGWIVLEEPDLGLAAFHAAPDVDTYFETWAIDGLTISVHDAPDMDTFVRDAYDFAFASGDSGCEVADDPGLRSDGDIQVISALYDCGDTATAAVLGIYNTAAGRGALLQGQRDNLPDAESDQALLDAILATVAF